VIFDEPFIMLSRMIVLCVLLFMVFKFYYFDGLWCLTDLFMLVVSFNYIKSIEFIDYKTKVMKLFYYASKMKINFLRINLVGTSEKNKTLYILLQRG